MAEPGTKVAGEHTTTRTVDGVKVEETTITWNATRRVSVDYRAGDVDLYDDPHDLTSFDEPLDEQELRDLLATYGLHGFKLVVDDPNTLVTEMLEAAAGRLCADDTEGISLVAALLDAVLDDDAKAARPAIDIVRAEIGAGRSRPGEADRLPRASRPLLGLWPSSRSSDGARHPIAESPPQQRLARWHPPCGGEMGRALVGRLRRLSAHRAGPEQTDIRRNRKPDSRSPDHRAAIAGALGRNGLTSAAKEMLAGVRSDAHIIQTIDHTAVDPDATEHAIALLAMTEAQLGVVVCPNCGSDNIQEVGSVTYWCRGQLRASPDGTEFEDREADQLSGDHVASHYECATCLTEISRQVPDRHAEYRVVDRTLAARDPARVLYGPRSINDQAHAQELLDAVRQQGADAEIETRIPGAWK